MRVTYLKIPKIGILFIVIGFVIPSIVMILSGIILNPSSFFNDLKSLKSFYTLVKTQLILGIINTLPFIAITIILINNTKNNQYFKISYRQKCGVIGAAGAIFFISFLFNIIYYIDLFSSSPSSTGSLIFVVLPIYSFFLIPVGYFLGQWIGSSLDRKKQEMSEQKFKKELFIYEIFALIFFLFLLILFLSAEIIPL